MGGAARRPETASAATPRGPANRRPGVLRLPGLRPVPRCRVPLPGSAPARL